MVPWRDSRRCKYFIKDRTRGLEWMDFAEAVIANRFDNQRVYVAYTLPDGGVDVVRGGRVFADLAKRAVRSAQMSNSDARCNGFTQGGKQCRGIATGRWHGIDVCSMHDPEGTYAKADPDYRKVVLGMLRGIKDTEVARLNDRLGALLLARFGPGKGRY